MSTAIEKKELKEVNVIREGNQIIIPDTMTYQEAIKWIQRKEESEEKEVAILDEIPCYPLDGAVALLRAVREIYGFVSMQDTPTFWGPQPPLLIQVQLADGSFATALAGRIAIPKWQGGFIDIGMPPAPKLVISGKIKKRFEAEVKDVITMAREVLKRESIYKGQAIRVDLSYMFEDRPFHPINDAPTFFDVSNVDEAGLILNPETDFQLAANIYLLIERSKECSDNGISLKHGCLLMGSFGTGKTLTAKIMGSKCVRNKWSFIYLKNSAHLAEGLRMAKLYSPAVVFAEDIDQALDEGRTENVNTILNTIDGVDTKDTPIITILTTNNVENIESAFLRAGRIDTVIKFEPPDAKTVIRFVEKYACDDDNHSLIEKGADLGPVGLEMAGFVPAFVNECIQKAKRFAMLREGGDVNGKVTANDLIVAAKALKKHIALVERKEEQTEEEKVAEALTLVNAQ